MFENKVVLFVSKLNTKLVSVYISSPIFVFVILLKKKTTFESFYNFKTLLTQMWFTSVFITNTGTKGETIHEVHFSVWKKEENFSV